jgi:hypothetical protein
MVEQDFHDSTRFERAAIQANICHGSQRISGLTRLWHSRTKSSFAFVRSDFKLRPEELKTNL